MPDKKTFYITTPIYYPSGNMHIGHTYTTVAADSMTPISSPAPTSTARRSSARPRKRALRPSSTSTKSSPKPKSCGS